jgi:hypothetical protein
VFLAVFLAVQWPFSDFLMSEAARNWFFGAHYQDYATGPNSYIVRGIFFHERTSQNFWANMGLAAAASVLMCRFGIAWADGMRKVQR